jgi:hypothetical protein
MSQSGESYENGFAEDAHAIGSRGVSFLFGALLLYFSKSGFSIVLVSRLRMISNIRKFSRMWFRIFD